MVDGGGVGVGGGAGRLGSVGGGGGGVVTWPASMSAWVDGVAGGAGRRSSPGARVVDVAGQSTVIRSESVTVTSVRVTLPVLSTVKL